MTRIVNNSRGHGLRWKERVVIYRVQCNNIKMLKLSQVLFKAALSRSVLNGKELAKRLITNIQTQIQIERDQNQAFYRKYPHWATPELHIMNVGFDAASLSYIKEKINLASSIGIKFQLHQFLQHNTSEEKYHEKFKKIMEQQKVNIREIDILAPHSCFEEMSKLITTLNDNANISGILLQLPLQPSLKPYTEELIELIDPLKDVDCLTLTNRAKIIEPTSMQVMPCTPSAVLKILDQYNINVEGKKVVIAGRSSLVGLPLFHILLNRNATITLCHQKTVNLNQLTSQADMVISAVGKPNLITQLKYNSIAIDIGISRNSNNKLNGDILEEAKRDCLLSTPVPGGVGPLTVTMLMDNTVKLWKAQMRLRQNCLNY